jgi:hypothetical protein
LTALRELKSESNRTVVDQIDRHLRTENAARSFQTPAPETIDHPLDQRFGMIGITGASERGPQTPGEVAVEGELAHDKDFPAYLHDGVIHPALLVREDADSGDSVDSGINIR